ncbi:MAG: diaminopimelate epimerase [Chlamydiota bacterium]|jgi:diaminopimelate epimerase
MFFTKYNQVGNDFIIIDDREGHFPILNKVFIKKLCHRNFGIGADGIILLQKSKKCDYRMRILNSDGNEAESCGNGICCLTHYLHDKELIDQRVSLELVDTQVSVDIDQGNVSLAIKVPEKSKFFQKVTLGKQEITYHFVNSGVPHVITFVDDLELVNVSSLGSLLRNHTHFQPRGANINFASYKGGSSIFVRTYERGVESETLGCGTGAIASAFAAKEVLKLEGPIKVVHPGGVVEIRFSLPEQVQLVAKPEKIFSGQVNLKIGERK